LAEAGNQLGINAVGLRAREATLSEGFDRSRVNDADSVARLVQKESQCFAISAGGFQTGMNSLNALLLEPLLELCKASRGVGKDFMLEFAAWLDEAGVEL